MLVFLKKALANQDAEIDPDVRDEVATFHEAVDLVSKKPVPRGPVFYTENYFKDAYTCLRVH